MKTLLAKLAWNRTVGLYIDDREVAVSLVGLTPIGPVEITRKQDKYLSDGLSSVLERLLKPILDHRKPHRTPVILGVPALRVYFSTRPIKSTTKSDASPKILLHEVLQSPTHNIDEMAVDLIRAQPGKRPVASLAACRKKYLTGLMATLAALDVPMPMAEPAPHALVRGAAQVAKRPRRSKVALRVFVGHRQGLAVAIAGNLPVVWRTFGMSEGSEGRDLRAVARTIQSLLRYCGVESPIDTVLVHGPATLQDRFEVEEFKTQTDLPLRWCDGPGLDAGATAYGLALGALSPSTPAFDLARALKPRPSLWAIFPWQESILQLAFLICLGLFLHFRLQTLHEQSLAIQRDNDRIAWSRSVPLDQLEREKKDLDRRLESIRGFVGTRVLWSDYAQNLAERLPPTASLSSFQGFAELDSGGGKKKAATKGKRSLVLRATIPAAKTGLLPPEVDGFVTAIRSHASLIREFPLIELGDIRAAQGEKEAGGAKDKAPLASFAVVCLPAVNKKSKAHDGNAKRSGH